MELIIQKENMDMAISMAMGIKGLRHGIKNLFDMIFVILYDFINLLS